MTVNLEDLKASQGQQHHPTYLSLGRSSLECDLCFLIDNAVNRYVSHINRTDPEYLLHKSCGPVRLFAVGRVRTPRGDLRADDTDEAVDQVELWHKLSIGIGPDASRSVALCDLGPHVIMVAETGNVRSRSFSDRTDRE